MKSVKQYIIETFKVDSARIASTNLVGRLERSGVNIDSPINKGNAALVDALAKKVLGDSTGQSDLKTASVFPVFATNKCPVCSGITVQAKITTGRTVPFCPKCRVAIKVPDNGTE